MVFKFRNKFKQEWKDISHIHSEFQAHKIYKIDKMLNWAALLVCRLEMMTMTIFIHVVYQKTLHKLEKFIVKIFFISIFLAKVIPIDILFSKILSFHCEIFLKLKQWPMGLYFHSKTCLVLKKWRGLL